MSDYISRDKVAQAFEDADVDVCEDYGEYYGCEWGFSRDAVRKIVAELPAADVAPVVYCKDCEFLKFSDCYGECRGGYLGIVRPMDYCSRGLRREEEKYDQD